MLITVCFVFQMIPVEKIDLSAHKEGTEDILEGTLFRDMEQALVVVKRYRDENSWVCDAVKIREDLTGFLIAPRSDAMERTKGSIPYLVRMFPHRLPLQGSLPIAIDRTV